MGCAVSYGYPAGCSQADHDRAFDNLGDCIDDDLSADEMKCDCGHFEAPARVTKNRYDETFCGRCRVITNLHANYPGKFPELPPVKPPSKAQQIRSLMEDSGYSRAEATALVKAGF